MDLFFSKNKTLVFLYSLFFIGSFYLLSHCFYTAFWYDEAYTILLVRHSFSQLWYITANDVHPPLYYVLLKLYTYVAGTSVVSLRIFSALPVIGCMLLGITIVRKEFGDKVSFFFLLLFILLPVIQYTASEIRMYSLAMFFVLCSVIYAYKLYFAFNKANFIKLTIFSLAAAYTHYYALMAVFFIYSIFLVVLFFEQRKSVLLFLGVGLVFILGYLPWLINIPQQMGQVADEYWINQTRLKDILFYVYYPFSIELDLVGSTYPLKNFILQFSILAILFFILCYVLIKVSRNLSVKNKTRFIFANLCLLVFILVLSFVIAYSFLIKPVFVTRYMNPILGLLILFLSINLGLLDYSKKITKTLVIVFFVLLSALSFKRYVIQYESNKLDQSIQNDIIKFAEEKVDNNTVFLYSDSRSFAIAFGNILYPNHKHFQRIRFTEKYYKQYLKNFNCEPIFNFEDVDPNFKKALIIKNVDKDDSFMNVYLDSIEVVKSYNIIDRKNFKGHVVYELERK